MIGGSTIVHLILLLLLMYYRTSASAADGITEITWIEAPPPAPAVEEAAPPVARVQTKAAPIQEVKTAPSKAQETTQFKRELVRAQVAPKPQSSKSVEDALSQQLDNSSKSSYSRTRVASLVTPPKVGTPSPAGVPETAEQPKVTSQLRRDESVPKGTPSDLQRTPDASKRSVTLAKPESSPQKLRAATDPADASKVRNVAGAQLAGPVADRQLLSHVTPVYPEWAKKDGVEASVTLRFFVLPNGLVKENVLIEKTSGFSDFDEASKAALLQWQFEPLGGAAEQWGRITFHFRLSDS